MENEMKSRNQIPDAYAEITGGSISKVQGTVYFYEVHNGTVITVNVSGLPDNNTGNFYGFHIHEGENCNENGKDHFSGSKSHYNPSTMQHPWHAGDLPVLMGNNGFAWCEIYTNRFFPEDIIGKTVIIHSEADDYRSQPSGNPGTKIACGVIKEMETGEI